MPEGRKITASLHGALLLMLSPFAACGSEDLGGDGDLATWVTEPEYQFGDAPDREVFFQRPFVRVDPARNRVVVGDPGSSQITTWTPEGSLNLILGRRGQGPGEFTTIGTLYIEPDGSMAVVDAGGSRFTYYAANGELIETVLGPGTSVSYERFRVALAPPRDGIHLGFASIASSLEVGLPMGPFPGGDPYVRQPLLSVRRLESGQWDDPEPVLWRDVSNRTLVMLWGDNRRSFGAQPFGDPDQVALRPGGALMMRTKGAPGAVELIDVNGEGDTIWHRRLRFDPRELTSEVIEEELVLMVDATAEFYEAQMTRQQLRVNYAEALYRPRYLPAAYGFPLLSASGEVWLRTLEVADSLRTYYVVPKGDPDAPPRRVLLPESLRIGDATETHVWGIWRDALDVPHVVGRRLVPVS